MCQFPTMKFHATTFSGAEYIQMLEATQGGLRTIVTWKNDETQMSLGFPEAAFGRRTFYCLFLAFEKKILAVSFKHLDQKTKFRILTPPISSALIAIPVA